MEFWKGRPGAPALRAQVLSAIAPYLVAIALLIALAVASVDILSAVRAYVGGESLWSKAQKESVRALERYAESGDGADFETYRREIAVPLGDREARLELDRPEPRLDIARAGFLAGRNHPDDIDGMIRLFRRFRNVSFMQRAIATWAAGDVEIAAIVAAADELHRLHTGAAPPGAFAAALARLHAANARVTPLEEQFSSTLGDASRRVGTLLQYGTVGLACLLIAIATLFSQRMLRRNTEIEHALRTSEERFELAVRGSNDGIWNWSSGDAEVYLSSRAVELLGFPDGAAPRDPPAMLALVHPDQRDAVADAVRAMLLARTALDVEFRFRTWDGAFRWAHVRGRALRTRAGVRAAGSLTDISDRMHADEQRREFAAEAQRRAEKAQIALLEQVQGRVGRELHDDLGQQLTGVAFLAKALEQRLSEASPAERDQTSWIVKLINDAIDRVRFMSRQLNPMALDELTLGSALERLVADVHGIFGTRITLQMSEEETQIPGAHASQFFRIAQESITNALRHGQATHIDVRLHARGAGARLAVCDNGLGFAVREVDPSASLGLRSMAIRAETLSGRLRIRSGRRGTILIVRSASCGHAPAERRA